ncbi:MAG TPA: hypothetical protein VMT89_00105, partial [Candidatus Acidoferrales bacterium]|nr:hypothetical protein [Candidatus Acidoferrales bacterium]
MLRFRIPETVVLTATAFYQDGHTELVSLRVPLDFLAKAAPAAAAAAATHVDAAGSYRWITIHPHGSDEKGQPVKSRESETQPGTWHVVA